MHHGPNATITIDVSLIPDTVRDELLEAMTAPMDKFYANPENQRKFEEWLAKKQAEGRKKHGS